MNRQKGMFVSGLFSDRFFAARDINDMHLNFFPDELIHVLYA